MRTFLLLLIVLVSLIPACAPSPSEIQDATQPPPVDPTQPELPAMTPLEWILSRPFQEAPGGQAEVVEDGFPEGYQPQEIGYQTANLPDSGLEVGITQVTYEHPIDGQVYTKDSVIVQICSHQNQEARSEHLGLMVGSEDSWDYQEIGNQLTARFYSGSGDGRIWISGPYLIAIWSSLDTSAGDPTVDPMVDAFAALYIEYYPPN